MSGAMIVCCRVCGDPLRRWYDTEDGRLLEWTENCDGCDLYASSFAYGNSEERIGVIVSTWCYAESGPADWREQFEEARHIYASDTGRGLYRAMMERRDDMTPKLVLADWLDDNECPLSAAYLRRKT
jgi:uncharacterized protein (TIGR02996 family)